MNSVKILHASRYCASNVEPCHTLPISLSPFRDHCATRPQQLWWMRCNSPLKLVVMLMSRLQVWPLHITNHRQQQAVSYVELILVLLKLFPESNRVPIFNIIFLKKGVKNNNCIKMWYGVFVEWPSRWPRNHTVRKVQRHVQIVRCSQPIQVVIIGGLNQYASSVLVKVTRCLCNVFTDSNLECFL